jgi:methylthioribose-1-phosphate isomerase
VKINNIQYQSVWLEENTDRICYINQNFLPFHFVIEEMRTADEAVRAIKEMRVRGAPLIGVVAAFGMYLAVKESAGSTDPVTYVKSWADKLLTARPTAINPGLTVNRIVASLHQPGNMQEKIKIVRDLVLLITEEEKDYCYRIGLHGKELIRSISKAKNGQPVNILTHCNAGWLATVDYGTATAPVYLSHDEGIPLHIWVDETRPRNQGARLTAWELLQHGVPHTVIPDNTGGHLMQTGRVDLVLTGSDRTTSNGDVVNKIGTYLKALAARDNAIPFYVAVPSSSIDFNIDDPPKDIPIEERNPEEVRFIEGLADERVRKIRIIPDSHPVANYAFDITPARLVTGLITERGICQAKPGDIQALFPGRVAKKQ